MEDFEFRSQLHWIGGIALLLVCLATSDLPAYAALILVGASIATLAILDQRMPINSPSSQGV